MVLISLVFVLLVAVKIMMSIYVRVVVMLILVNVFVSSKMRTKAKNIMTFHVKLE